ncbi:FAD-binding protein, partial [Chloroflexota bacterium]
VGAVGVSQKGDITVFKAKAVILAAGGANRLFPNVASTIAEPSYGTYGAGFHLAFDVGAPLVDMEFVQFRDSPPGAARYGGRYLNSLGERFMERYDPQALEKTTRCRVVEAIYRETVAGRGPINWEVAGIRETEKEMMLAQEFVGKKFVEIVIDFQRCLGGTRINERAETPVPGLFAAGESSGGVHGCNRMQGDAFLETQVFGANAGRNAAALAQNIEITDVAPSQIEEEKSRLSHISGTLDPAGVTASVQKTMWEQAGVIRDKVHLQDAISKFEQLRKETALQLSGDDLFAALEAADLILTGELVARAALAREETRGAQIRDDYPDADDKNWLKHVCLTSRGGDIAVSTVPVVTKAK